MNTTNKDRPVSIHTSDRILYKRCRRKWDYESFLHQNLEPKGISPALWFGTGMHFALEDYHGYNKFGNPVEAFEAYYKCFNRDTELNMDCETLGMLAPGMLNYYVNEWLPRRKPFKTLWLDGEPQVEVEIVLNLPQISKELNLNLNLGRDVVYSMRLDRVVEDDLGRLWIEDYKTAKQFDVNKLETDPQVSAYCWGAEIYYGKPIEGMLYLQMKKELVDDPRILKNGDISSDKSQNTNFYRYQEMLKFKYGLGPIPDKNQECLDYLIAQESELGDSIIRYDLIRRNEYSRKKEYDFIAMEIPEMLNPNLPIYINPTSNCYRDCSFRTVCLAQNDNLDFNFILQENFQPKRTDSDKWRKKIKYPNIKKGVN